MSDRSPREIRTKRAARFPLALLALGLFGVTGKTENES